MSEEVEKEYCDYCGKELFWDDYRDRMRCSDKECQYEIR